MADIADVFNALTGVIGTALYPAGVPAPGAASPVIGAPCRYYPGWPQRLQLDQDITAGIVNVSVFAPKGMYRNTTRYPYEWQGLPLPAATLSASVDDATGTVVTIAGTVSAQQNIALIIGFGSTRQAYAYAVQNTDTLSSIATALAALINPDTSATASGATVTIPGAFAITVRVGVVGTAVMEVMREAQVFSLDVWASTPALRDSAGSAIKTAIAPLRFVSLADGTLGRIITRGDHYDDESVKPIIYRRCLMYEVEYPTTLITPASEIIVFEQQLTGSSSAGSGFTVGGSPLGGNAGLGPSLPSAPQQTTFL